MRIAFLTSSYPRYEGDSSAPFVRSIAYSLKKLGNEVEVVAPFHPKVERGSDYFGIHVNWFRYVWSDRLHIMGHGQSLRSDVQLQPIVFLLLPLFFIASVIALYKTVRKQQSDVIYCHWVLPNGPAAVIVSKLLRIPFIVSLHGSDMFVASQNLLYSQVARWVFSNAMAVTACSTALQNGAKALGSPPTTYLIPWGADPKQFNPDKRSKTFRNSLGIQDHELMILAMGRMVFKKGFDRLLKAIEIVLVDQSNIKVVIAGDGPLRSDLVEQARELNLQDAVIFPGNIPWDQVPALLASADLFVVPSIKDQNGNQDGLPTVLLEAMASGTATISSDIGGIPLVIDDGRNGLLVVSGEVTSLTRAITELIKGKEKRKTISIQARIDIEAKYNWDQVGKKISRILAMSVWRSKEVPRIGSVYRELMLDYLGIEPEDGSFLDIGCFDGYVSTGFLVSPNVGIDLNPKVGSPNIVFVKANALELPFAPRSFRSIFALDVIEHLEDDTHFVPALLKTLNKNGHLVLTTPSQKISIGGKLLTRWVSRKWGHVYRLGYSREKLGGYFEGESNFKLISWNAPAWRAFYLPLSFLFRINHKLGIMWLRSIAHWDSRHREGEKGYWVVNLQRTG